MSVDLVTAITEAHLRERVRKPSAFVLHGTGETNKDSCLKTYRKGDVCPNFFIDEQGLTYMVVDPEKYIARHAGMTQEQVDLYARGYGHWSHFHQPLNADKPVDVGQEYSGYRTWRETWQGIPSPLGLATGQHPNDSIGIEMLSLTNRPPLVYTEAQYEALAILLKAQSLKFSLPLTRRFVLGHGDTNPIARCSEAGPWDPGLRFNFNKVWDLIAQMEKRK